MLVPTPPMGWNSWNTFGENINEKVVRDAADKMIELGLDKIGYKYVVIDDCWSLRERDPKTNRIVEDPVKFPSGMKALADYVHSKDLKFGMYSCAGIRTCADYPGSYGHEFLDARTFAGFGVDFLKYDYCYHAIDNHAPDLYRRMGQALRACGRDILFSACDWGAEDVWSWIRSTGAHMYRSTGDIFDNFVSMRDIATSQVPKMAFSAPNCFNDMDMLTIGMFGKGNVGSTGCNLEDYKTQFALWCLMGSPLMLGCNLTAITPEVIEIIGNRELLAINQDPAAGQTFKVEYGWSIPNFLVLAKLLEGGDTAIGFFNMDDAPHGVNIMLDKVGFPYESGLKLSMRECYTGETRLSGRDTIREDDIPAHACRIYRCTPVEA